MDKETLNDGCAGPFGCLGLIFSGVAGFAGFCSGLFVSALLGSGEGATLYFGLSGAVGGIYLFWHTVTHSN